LPPILKERAMQLDTIENRIDKYYESQPWKPRAHLGPSGAGNPCDRSLWLGFRWAIRDSFPGRILRLFSRGEREEAHAVANLAAIGIKVTETGNNQRKLDFGGHVKGSVDGIILDYQGKPHIFECKTHGKKSFDDMLKNGIPEAHKIQMSCYMAGTGIDRALYYAVCKDDDRLFIERYKYEEHKAKDALTRLKRTALLDSIPAPISSDPTWYQCRFCSTPCHGLQTREVNCRTCCHSTPRPDGYWHCEKNKYTLSEALQRTGCRYHTPHPDLMKAKMVADKCTEWSAYYESIGLIGEDGADSREVLK
jgi:hypothetical protein